MNTYAVFDLETTGFSPGRDAITELGWLVVRDGIVGEPASLLVLPSVPVPDDVAQLTGITTRMLLEQGVPLEEALRTFSREIGDSIAFGLYLEACDALPLIGHNVIRFDAPFLEAALSTCGFASPSRARYHDTAAIYKAGKLGIPQSWPMGAHHRWAEYVLARQVRGLKYSLAHCCAELGICTTDVVAHRAGGDVVATQRLYEALLAAQAITR